MSFPVLIVLAAIANMIIGSVWYLPATFGTIWMREAKVPVGNVKKSTMISSIVTGFICYLVTGAVLAFVLPFGTTSLRDLLIMTVTLWLGFILMVRLTHSMFEQKSISYVAITSGHDLVSLLVTTIILSLVAVPVVLPAA